MAKKKLKAGQQGEVVAFITERKAVKKLQINLEQFRKLCILKGVYPRQPKTAKLKGTNKTYYLVKDVKFISHDPLIQTFRDIKVYNRRLKHYKAKQNKEQVIKHMLNEPTYSLDRIIKERYPTFEDAMRDMDDAITHIYLYSRFPSNSKYPSNLEIRRCARLCKEWEHYISLTHAVRKVFVSVKGYYYQVDLNGHTVTYVVPHRGSFVEQKNSVGLKTMGFFLELYQNLIGFVLFRLYTLQGLKYPPNLENGRLDELLDHLEAPSSDAPQTEQQKKTEERIDTLNTEKLIAQEKALENNDVTMTSSNDVSMTEENDEFEREVKKIEFNSNTDLFRGLKIFLSRETPTEQLEFLIKAFGGQVSVEGPFGTFPETDESITHQVVDRDTQRHMYLSRSYVQPQWIFDSVNEKILLPVSEYGPTAALPPHLSPFVDDSVEGYVPQRREILNKIKEAVENGTPYDIELEHAKAMEKKLPQETVEEEDNESDEEEEEEAEEIQEKEEQEEEVEKDEDEEQREREEQYERELQAELAGNSSVDDKKKKKKAKANPEEEKKKLAEMMLSKKDKGRYLFHVAKQKRKQRETDALVEKRKRNEEGGKQNNIKKAKSRE